MWFASGFRPRRWDPEGFTCCFDVHNLDVARLVRKFFVIQSESVPIGSDKRVTERGKNTHLTFQVLGE